MKFKVGQKIKMKEDCESGCYQRKGQKYVLELNEYGNLYAGNCSFQPVWQLIKKPSKPKVCKHKYSNGMSAREIHHSTKYIVSSSPNSMYTETTRTVDRLVAICKLCLEKEYI